jgi:hypothetical protein
MHKIAEQMGGLCLIYSELENKRSPVTFKCHNSLHKEFNLEAGQVKNSTMWCSQGSCKKRTGKVHKYDDMDVKELCADGSVQLDDDFKYENQDKKITYRCLKYGHSNQPRSFKWMMKQSTNGESLCEICAIL